MNTNGVVDYIKTFETVDYAKFLSRMEKSGSSVFPPKIVTSSVTNRSHEVKIHPFSCDVIIVTEGVPQGSSLTPTSWFLLMI